MKTGYPILETGYPIQKTDYPLWETRYPIQETDDGQFFRFMAILAGIQKSKKMASLIICPSYDIRF